jgi:hypothetical protein
VTDAAREPETTADDVCAFLDLVAAHRIREWLDNWKGLGHVVVGMERQGYALSLTKITDDGWRATFHSHPALSADGFATDDKPWGAVQCAAWEALGKRDQEAPASAENVSPL